MAVLIVGEIPSYYTIAVGVIVLAAVVLFTLLNLSRVRGRREAAAPAPGRHARPVMLPPFDGGKRPGLQPLPMEAALEIAYQTAASTHREPLPWVPPPLIEADRGDAASLLRQPVTDAHLGIAVPRAPEMPPLGNRGPTLESRLADRLRPLLQEWVDRNLRRVSESVVRAEVRAMIQRAEDATEDRLRRKRGRPRAALRHGAGNWGRRHP
jgi:hypothetical protein